MPISLELNALHFVVNTKGAEDFSPIQQRFNQLLKLEEEQSKDLNRTSERQQSIKIYFDHNATIKNFQKGELVLLWNKAKEKPSMHTCNIPNHPQAGLHYLQAHPWNYFS
jgi:hypothetical protein